MLRLKIHWMSCVKLSLMAVSLLSAAGCATFPGSLPADTAPQALARRELQALHALLLEAHPGAIDQANPAYRQRIEGGYRAALARLPEVQDEHDAGALASWYVVGFNDIHMGLSTDVAWGDSTITNGWHAARDSTGLVRVRVRATLPGWPLALPPVGAQWLHCDGLGLDEIYARDVRPYTFREPGIVSVWLTTRGLAVPAMSSLRKATCSFRLADGRQQSFPQHYQSVGETRIRELLDGDDYPARPSERINDLRRLPDGTLWVKAGQFGLDPEGETQLATLEPQLVASRDARRIVFDVRGNSGGDSRVGDRIFEAATGGMAFDSDGLPPLQRPYALVRVSEASIRALEPRITQISQALGDDDEATRTERGRQAALRAALARQEPWLREEGDEPVLTRQEAQRRHARLRGFTGPVVLLTDGACVRACLDFADRVLSVPGALQLGETTDFDSLYIDVGWLKLPSGNYLRLPLKVWRNRLRGNDQPWVPDLPLTVTGRSEADIRAAVLSALDGRTR